jgi:hypothetical protein
MTRTGSAPMQKLLKTLLFTLLTAASASASAAPMAYSINSDSGSGNSDSLYLIDLATGAGNRIGIVWLPSAELMDVEGLAFHPNETLYGIDDQSLKLFAIDTDTGLIDQNKIIRIETGDLTVGSNDFGMTFDCDANLYITSVAENSLYRLDLNGDTQLIGSLGTKPDSENINISALAAYGSPTRLYGLGNGTKDEGTVKDAPNLYEIDINNGSASEIGPLGSNVLDYTEGGLAFDSSGQLWAITDRTGLLDSGPSQVMRINTSTGAASDIRETTEVGFESLAVAVPSGCAPLGTGEHAVFIVQKRFEDNNDITPVELKIKCNTGLPLEQSLTVLPNEGAFGQFEVRFIVESFADGALDCEVWEETPPGYSSEYDCQSGSSCSTSAGSGPCSFEGVGIGQEDLCLIQNRVDPVEVVVTKEWLYSREELVIDDNADVDLYCSGFFNGDGSILGNGVMYWSWEFTGNPASHKATVFPDFAGATSCWTAEHPGTSAVEAQSTCSNPVSIKLGDVGHNCLVTNTVFFEGIPSLNQYGLMLISALMLLTGLIAVRRIG